SYFEELECPFDITKRRVDHRRPLRRNILLLRYSFQLGEQLASLGLLSGFRERDAEVAFHCIYTACCDRLAQVIYRFFEVAGLATANSHSPMQKEEVRSKLEPFFGKGDRLVVSARDV